MQFPATPAISGRNNRAVNSWLRHLLLVVAAAWLTTGCTTYQQKNRIIAHWQGGDIQGASAEATKQADQQARGKDGVVWRLEQGATLRAGGKFAASNDAFDQAQAEMEKYAQAAKVSLSSEGLALFSNQANFPYEGRAYDGIMLNTYKALNYLALGEFDKARPELIRAYQRQQDAVADNQKRIAATQQAAGEGKDGAAINRSLENPGLGTALTPVTGNLESVRGYADYVNPFTVFLDGLYFMIAAADHSDLERAQKSLERARQFAPQNGYLKRDLAVAGDLLHGRKLAPTTYVIFETGCAPLRSQLRIDVPIIISKVSYVGAAFPVLVFQDDFLPQLTVTNAAGRFDTALVANMDGVVAQAFKNEMPMIITRTLAATVAKATAAYAVNEQARRQDDVVGLLAQIGTAIYELAVNIADTRTWTTLPKEFQYCRFPTPADRRIDLTTPTGLKISLTLDPGTINLVYVKSVNRRGPLLVTQFRVK